MDGISSMFPVWASNWSGTSSEYTEGFGCVNPGPDVGTQIGKSGPSVYTALVQDHASAHSGNIDAISFYMQKMTKK